MIMIWHDVIWYGMVVIWYDTDMNWYDDDNDRTRCQDGNDMIWVWYDKGMIV